MPEPEANVKRAKLEFGFVPHNRSKHPNRRGQAARRGNEIRFAKIPFIRPNPINLKRILPSKFVFPKVVPAAFCLLALLTPAFAQDAATRLHQLFDDDQAWLLKTSPESATSLGYPGENDRWSDFSPAAIERSRQHAADNLKVLYAIERAQLNADDQLNYDLFLWRTKTDVDGNRFPGEYLAVDPLGGGVHSWVPQILQQAPTKNLKDYEDALARLNKVPELVDQNIALLREGIKRGITQPKVVMRDVPAQVDQILKDAPADSVMLKAFRNFPATISPADQDRLRRAANAAVDGVVYPAFRKWRDFLAKEYLPNCRETIGISAMPNGLEWYQSAIRTRTTTNLTPEQIHEIGLGEVKRIRAAMDTTIAQTGFKGSFDEFVAMLRTDPKFYFTNEQDLVTGYRDICKRVDEQLPKLFGKLPREPYGVEPMDAYYAPSQTSAFYEAGSVDGTRPGIYRVNTYKLDSRPKFEMEVLSMHESVPGHHLQIALQQEMPNVPEFRKRLETTAFVEGWGLYSESLGYEMGFYKDPYSRFGQLSFDMWRACRLVVDTGMHAMGWTRQQAIDYMKANTALSEQNITAEVDRYISWPGQALAYKIGQLKIRELRTTAEKRLGPAFDERAFHDVVLSAGPLPLEILQARVENWISTHAK
jgi:uncharacterized protein (DUF885 family)